MTFDHFENTPNANPTDGGSDPVNANVSLGAQALLILCQAVELAAKSGAFQPNQYTAIGQAYTHALDVLSEFKKKMEA